MEWLESLLHVPLWVVLVLMGVAFCAGVVDAIAGGGGMLNVPALMLGGLDPVSAVATNKLQGIFGVSAAVAAYGRAGLIDWQAMRLPVMCSALGGALGAVTAQLVPSDFLRLIVPFLLIGLGWFVLFSPKMTDIDTHARVRPMTFALSAALPIGWYDGFFGPGGGTFHFLSLIILLGQGVTKGAGNAKLLNFASGAGSFVLFALSGKINWALGLAMGIGSFAGSRIGAALALRRGAALIRPIVVLVSLLMALRLLLDAGHPVGQWLRANFG